MKLRTVTIDPSSGFVTVDMGGWAFGPTSFLVRVSLLGNSAGTVAARVDTLRVVGVYDQLAF